MTVLIHHGIKGQKWGIRRFQNADGSYTDAGKKRHKKGVLFVSGSSKTQSEDSAFYRKDLPDPIKEQLNASIERKEKIVVGDAPGIDRQTQDYLNSVGYKNVEIYGPGKKVRYSANPKWKTKPIDVPGAEEGSKEWLAKKDEAMSYVATHGLAIVIENGASATRKNVDRLVADMKEVKVYELMADKSDHWTDSK